MFWFMRVTGGVGMHEGYLPGYADSHGCIRLPSDMARIYYHNAPIGTPVKIVE
jgi:lipoprotein-anchoring transpeptidase ErfK/SrfK